MSLAPLPVCGLIAPEKLPHETHGVGYLYVVRFTTGVVKVGSTRNPYRRVSRYRSNLNPFGIDVVQCWLSRPHKDYARLEASLIKTAAGIGTRTRQAEYFYDVDFAKLVSRVEKVLPQVKPGPPPGPQAHLPCANQWRELNELHRVEEKRFALVRLAMGRARSGRTDLLPVIA